MLMPESYRVGTYTNLSKDHNPFSEKDLQGLGKKKMCSRILQAKKQSRCLIPAGNSKVVLYDLKRFLIIDTLTLGDSTFILDMAYCQNRSQLYLLVQEKAASLSENDKSKVRGLSPEKKWMDSTQIKLGKTEDARNQSQHNTTFQKILVFEVTQKECKINADWISCKNLDQRVD